MSCLWSKTAVVLVHVHYIFVPTQPALTCFNEELVSLLMDFDRGRSRKLEN